MNYTEEEWENISTAIRNFRQGLLDVGYESARSFEEAFRPFIRSLDRWMLNLTPEQKRSLGIPVLGVPAAPHKRQRWNIYSGARARRRMR